jgi:hypothetical protein
MNRRGFLQSVATAALHPSRQPNLGPVPHDSTSGQNLALDAADRARLKWIRAGQYRLVGIVAPIADTDRVVLVSYTDMGPEIRVRTWNEASPDPEWKRRDEEQVPVPVRTFTVWTSGRTPCHQILRGGPSGWTAELIFEVPVRLGIYLWKRRHTDIVALVEMAPSPPPGLSTALR